jgi:hypothetical protein
VKKLVVMKHIFYLIYVFLFFFLRKTRIVFIQNHQIVDSVDRFVIFVFIIFSGLSAGGDINLQTDVVGMIGNT